MNDLEKAENGASDPLSEDENLVGRDGARRTRYSLAEGAIVCCHAPNLRLWIERGLGITEATRKKYPEQSIFLDGSFTEAPFFDNEIRQYSLDHHAGCLRPITLATCEQAAVMAMQGLPLGEGDWNFYINDPDLDAVLSAWVLLNHVDLLRDEARLLWQAMPFIRVEGVIDALGLDMGVLTGLSRDQYRRCRADIDDLLAEERELKASGAWATIDLASYARELLEALDRMLLTQEDLERLLDIEELGRATIADQRLVVVASSQQGIYAVERQLKERHGKKLGLIILSLGDGRYTLRQVDAFMTKNLDDLYRELNEFDMKAGHDSDSDNRWGGSAEIGGAPRKTGSALSVDELLATVKRVYRKPSWLSRILGK